MRNPAAGFLIRHRAWLLVGFTLLLVLTVRVRLRDMPLERDEGEYAYAGQLILHGVPPYREAYNMKLPGTYVAYAAIMALFGQTPAAIHLGVALVNLASIVLVFLIGRALLDDVAGAAAAVCFALLSLSPSLLGLAGHATHFVLLPALAGVYLLLRGEGLGIRQRLANSRILRFILRHSVWLAGLFFGVAFLMKQHGIFFGIFGGLYLVWILALENRISESKNHTRADRSKIRDQTGKLMGHEPVTTKTLLLYALAWALPYALTCLFFLATGLFYQFLFWTVSYASTYATRFPLVYGADFLRRSLTEVVGPDLLLWLLPWAGALVMWWDERLVVRHRFFIMAFLLCSMAAASIGFYFRAHYFILLLPALALLSGVAVSRGLHLLQHDKTIELLLAIPILGLFLIGSLAAVLGNGSVLFGDSPDDAVLSIYSTTINSNAVEAADYIQAHAAKDARIAVIGSQPEIYFYANRRSATGYLYTYPLMEPQPYAAHMQEEMIAEIERARPEYAVYVNDDGSWLRSPGSQHKLEDWWGDYWPSNFDIVATYNIEEQQADPPVLGPAMNVDGSSKCLQVLKRKAEAATGH